MDTLKGEIVILLNGFQLAILHKKYNHFKFCDFGSSFSYVSAILELKEYPCMV